MRQYSRLRMAEANVPLSDIEMNGADGPRTRRPGIYASGSFIPLESMVDVTQSIGRLDMERLSRGEVIMVVTSTITVIALTCVAVVVTILNPQF